MLTRRTVLAGLPLAALGACAGEKVYAPDAQVQQAAVSGSGTPAVTLYTMRDTGNGSGAHTALVIDASQRVLWDPAGSFSHDSIPERNDLLFGITPLIEEYWVSYHARATFYVVGRRKLVSPQTAERLLNDFKAAGPVGKANCTRVTSAVLRQVPEFESLPATWFPVTLDTAFSKLPGVETETYREGDEDDKRVALMRLESEIRTAALRR
ncbi:MAG: hypothetical protein ABR504_02500 [Paracoccaceae bacterium]